MIRHGHQNPEQETHFATARIDCEKRKRIKLISLDLKYKIGW